MKRIVILSAIFSAFFSACTQTVQDNSPSDSTVIATVNEEPLTQTDFEKSQAWLPVFARQLESNSSLEIQRFWSLVQIMTIAQNANQTHLLDNAEKRLAIKEALAAEAMAAIPCDIGTISDAEIAEWIAGHIDEIKEPPAFSVNYALVKNNSMIPVLGVLHTMSHGAQLGYNVYDPPPLDLTYVPKGSPQMLNQDGHPMVGSRFNYAFCAQVSENPEEPVQIGPFNIKDGVIFSCPEAIEKLKNAPLGRPILENIACSGTWNAFVIPLWRRDEAPMPAEKARQIAIDSITGMRREQCQQTYISDKLSKYRPPL